MRFIQHRSGHSYLSSHISYATPEGSHIPSTVNGALRERPRARACFTPTSSGVNSRPPGPGGRDAIARLSSHIEIMSGLVTAADGHSYEFVAIQRWLQAATSPR